MKLKLIVYILIMTILAWGGLLILGSPEALAESKSINVEVSATVTPLFEVRATPQNFQSNEQLDFNIISSTEKRPQIIRERKPEKILYTVYTL